jgi:ElaB/YqjD/DUF883 family membrane-anchored ribosome-binding protein
MAEIANKVTNVRDRLQDVTYKAQEAASNLGHTAQDLAATATEKADTALSTVGESMSSLAGTIRERGPQEGIMGSAATTVAQGLQTGGQYLKQHRLSDIGDDLTSLIRHHPLPAICVALGLGWLLGMATRR